MDNIWIKNLFFLILSIIPSLIYAIKKYSENINKIEKKETELNIINKYDPQSPEVIFINSQIEEIKSSFSFLGLFMCNTIFSLVFVNFTILINNNITNYKPYIVSLICSFLLFLAHELIFFKNMY